VKALVTGGAGFIGSALVDRLLAEDHAVDVVDNLSTGSYANLADARTTADRRLTFQQIDIRSPDLASLVQRRRPDVVFHLAARVDVGASVADPILDADININGSLQVLEAARAAGVAKVVFASSGGAIYGDVAASDLPTRESHPGHPRSPHGVAKKAVTDYLRAYREMYALEFSSLALAHVYGPRQKPDGGSGVVACFAGHLLRGEPCTISGDGGQTRDFVYVDDVVDALARAASRGSGLLVNVGSGVETSINQLYGVMAAAAGVDRPAEHGRARPGELRRSVLDPSRAAIQLGWTPWTSLIEGTGATMDWMRSGSRD
jgi:UDP-glucose 4-epimerase